MLFSTPVLSWGDHRGDSYQMSVRASRQGKQPGKQAEGWGKGQGLQRDQWGWAKWSQAGGQRAAKGLPLLPFPILSASDLKVIL